MMTRKLLLLYLAFGIAPLFCKAQTMSKEELADAIIAAMEYCNDTDRHINKREYIVADKVMIFDTGFDYKSAPDSLVDELNKRSRFDFFTNQHDYIKKHKIWKMEFEVIHNYRVIDNNNVILAVSGETSCYKRRLLGKFRPAALCPDRIFMISSWSEISGEWEIYHEDFVYYLCEKEGVYDDATLATMLYENLQHGKLNTMDEFVLLLNYLRKKEETPQDDAINKLLCCYIDEHPEAKETLEDYFLLLSRIKIHGDNADLIEGNYRKIAAENSKE